MITTTIWGGLGNQMFMYAATRAMALRNHTSVAFNLKQGFKDDYRFKRNLELRHFKLELPETKIESFDYPLGKYVRFISRKLGFNLLNPSMRFIKDTGNPNDLISNPIKNAFLTGYWASEQYFKDYEDIIKTDFTIREDEISEDVTKELDYIKSLGRDIVMLGVRRYQECKNTSEMPSDAFNSNEVYYKNAINYMSKRLTDPVFVVFSQAQGWVRQNVDDGSHNFYYVKPKTGENSAIEDMWLMTNCDHFIISNSTYYWWAAWLAASKNKMVLCPKYDSPYMRCKDWIEIRNK